MSSATLEAATATAKPWRLGARTRKAVLVLHIVLTLLQANPANVVAALIARLAGTFDLGLSNLFLVDDPTLAVLLNYGAAALAWLLITAVVVRLASRIG